MPSKYLIQADFDTYGLSAAPTPTDSQIIAASSLVDGYLKRPEGLVWQPDFNGLPCYMAAMSPALTFTAQGPISPGTNVNVSIGSPATFPQLTDLIGDVVILDRGSASLTEACVISAFTPGVIQLAKVAQAHSTGCTMDQGLIIMEERDLPAKRSIARVSRPPARLLAGLGRYGYGRRIDQTAGQYNEVNLLAAIQAFGGPPMWTAWDPTQASVSVKTQEIWVPAGLLLAYYSEVRIFYVAGFQQSALPPIIKSATAAILTSQAMQPELSGNIKMAKAGNSAIERFSNTILDDDMRNMLDAYRARLVV